MNIRHFLFLMPLIFTSVTLWAKPDPALIDYFATPAVHQNAVISPDGKTIVVVYNQNERRILVFMDRATLKPTFQFAFSGDGEVSWLRWVTNERIIFSSAYNLGYRSEPVTTGIIFSLNIKKQDMDIVFHPGDVGSKFTRFVKEASYKGYSRLCSPVNDPSIGAFAFYKSYDADVTYEDIKVFKFEDKKERVIEKIRSPIRGFIDDAVCDSKGRVRYVSGIVGKGVNQLYKLNIGNDKWELVKEDRDGYKVPIPIGMTRDDNYVYFKDFSTGAAKLIKEEISTGTQQVLYENNKVSYSRSAMDLVTGEVVGIETDDGLPAWHPMNTGSDFEKSFFSLNQALPGQVFSVLTSSQDQKHSVVFVSADNNPGDYYLFDGENKKLDFLFASRPTDPPSVLGKTEVIEVVTEDGTQLQGYLTVPTVGEAPYPMVVMPHGGPHGVRDYWGYDDEVQLLASHGYAVLRVNYRGSAGYGEDFASAGKGYWGSVIQQDIAASTRSMIQREDIDGQRICIYGGSFGAYSAMMNSALYPELYRCAIGAYGLYDLSLLSKRGDIKESRTNDYYLEDVLPDTKEEVAKYSPVAQASKIKQPVLLIHGGEDNRTPPEHAKAMKKALEQMGNQPEWLYERTEGHGFYEKENVVKAYTAMIEFLDKHIGRE